MIRKLKFKEDGVGTVAFCSAPPPLTQRTTDNAPYLKEGDINIFMNMPCPLKVLAKKALKAFADEYNASHELKPYSPLFMEEDSKGIEGELKNSRVEEEIPEILVASDLHTVLSREFKKRFINTGIYEPVTTAAMLQQMLPEYCNLVRNENMAVIGTGYWSIVCNLSLELGVLYPRQWTDMANPEFRDLISVHSYHGKASIAAMLLFLRKRLGEGAIIRFGSNIRNIWHFAEILKRMDSSEPRRTPLNLLPNAATVQMPSKKNAGILEFDEGPVLAPLLMYVKDSKRKICQPVIDFFLGPVMKQTLLRGDFHMTDELNRNAPYCLQSCKTLIDNDYKTLSEDLNRELREDFEHDVFTM